MSHKLHVLVASTLMGVAVATPVVGQTAFGTVDVSHLALSAPVATTKVDAGLKGATGEVEVVVRLAGEPLVAVNGPNAKRLGAALTPAQQMNHSATLRAAQSATMTRLAALGAQELGRVRIAYNALIVRVDASALQGIAALPEVQSIRKVGNYEMDLSQTVPYIGASAVQGIGVDGAGITVAVLDSGIDYTHRNLGGGGTLAAYQAAYGTSRTDPKNTTTDGLFPTSKVVAGFDFVGEAWPTFGDRTEDPDPIDFEGHGTHVADIIAGRSTDGLHKGVAPGASLMAVKVCSAVSSSCNGVALLKGIDYALDPNGDGAMNDAADVINMSLGASYGQIEDDLSLASANAVRAGVVVVASAGNSADRPYITGSPSATPEVISVAQTQVPSASAIALKINSPAGIAGLYPNTETVTWAPIGAGFTGDVVFAGRGCNGDPLPSVAGKIALIDRGVCSISQKVRNASNAGATGVLIGLVAPGDAVTFSNGGECPATPDGTCKPTLIIIQSYANLIKANIAAPVNVTVSPAIATSLAGSMVGSSSRGPNYSFSAIKPDIGAPGASVSAIAGTGTGTEPFGGTSGAAPMVAGSAALLLDAYPSRTPLEIKAMLMNRAETNIAINPATQRDPVTNLPVLAPITRIGGGEVRVDRAISTKYAAWDSRDPAGSLSFGFHDAIGDLTLNRRVVVRNFTNQRVTLPISPGFRYANDAASGAIEVKTPGSVTVPANGTASFAIQLKVNAAKLTPWNLSGGGVQGNGALLQAVEYDGYLTIGSGADAIRMPWHVLPAKSAAVSASTESLSLSGGTGSFALTNTGATAGGVDLFALTGTSPRIGASNLPGAGDNFAVIDLRSVGVRLAGGNVQFAINTFGERSHPAYPAEFDVYVDSNNDGTDDFVVYTAELTGFAATGQTVVFVRRLTSSTASAFFFADSDLKSGNMIMTAPLAALGLTPASKFRFSVYAFDNYFTGNLTDAVENMTVTLGTPRYTPLGATSVPVGGTVNVPVQEVPGGAAASPSQSGLLLLYRDARAKQEAQTITIQ
jgi:subtilisin family serine protease